MKILQINNHYKSGSTGKNVCDSHNYYLEKGYGSIVCYGLGDDVKESGIS